MVAIFIQRLLIAPLLVLSLGLPAHSQQAQEVLAEGAVLTLPVLDKDQNTLDQLTIHAVEITDKNDEQILSLEPHVIDADQAEKLLPKRQFGIWAQAIRSKVEIRKDKLEGIAFAVSSSSLGFLGLWVVAGNSASSSAIIGVTMLTVGSFHSLATETWQSYLQKGLYIKNALGLIKKDLVENEMVKSLGNISAGAAFNIAPTTLALILTGHYHDFATAALTGVLGAYDYTVDIAAGKLNRRGYISDRLMTKIVRYRLLAGPVLEMFSLSGSSTAQMIMAGIGTAGIAAIFRGEKLMDDINKAVSIFTLKSLRKKYCSDLLSVYPMPHIRSFEDVQ